MNKDDNFVSFMDRFMRGEAPSEQEFLFHFDHQNGVPENALAAGAVAPAFGLPDQEGNIRSVSDMMGERGLLLVFARSAHWCPYCRNQLAELNIQRSQVMESGFNIMAITSDPPGRIQEFCAEHQIAYPILSDPTGIAMDAFGVRNEHIPPNELQGGGPLPHPGHFLIGSDGRIMAREFTGDIRHRVSASTLIAEVDDELDGGLILSAENLDARIALSSNQAFGGQELAVTVVVSVAPGVHIYGSEAKPPYASLSVSFANDGLLAMQQFSFPDSEMIHLDALGETLPVLSGQFIVRGRVRLRWSPPRSPFAELSDFVSARAISPGHYTLGGKLRYQACSEAECFPPQTIGFALPLEIQANARAGAAVRFGDFEIPPPAD